MSPASQPATLHFLTVRSVPARRVRGLARQLLPHKQPPLAHGRQQRHCRDHPAAVAARRAARRRLLRRARLLELLLLEIGVGVGDERACDVVHAANVSVVGPKHFQPEDGADGEQMCPRHQDGHCIGHCIEAPRRPLHWPRILTMRGAPRARLPSRSASRWRCVRLCSRSSTPSWKAARFASCLCRCCTTFGSTCAHHKQTTHDESPCVYAWERGGVSAGRENMHGSCMRACNTGVGAKGIITCWYSFDCFSAHWPSTSDSRALVSAALAAQPAR